jgi:microcystin-dependent protein
VPEFLPVADPANPSAGIEASPEVSKAVGSLADAIADATSGEPTNLRIGTVTSLADPAATGRVRVDIAGTTWCSRASDVSLSVGRRVIVMQQGAVMIVVGSIGGGEAHPVGALLSYAGAAAPAGWLLCDGAAVSRSTYAALFAVLGTTYGVGDGSTTFNVPDLRNRVPVGSGSTYTRAQTGGAATVTLSSSQMPSHSHSFSDSTDSAGSHGHSGSADSGGSHAHSYTAAFSRSDLVAGAMTNGATAGGSTTGSAGAHAHSVTINSGGSHTHTLSGSTASTGSGGSHENMPPFVAMPTIIRAL